jgi:hypothetical protein
MNFKPIEARYHQDCSNDRMALFDGSSWVCPARRLFSLRERTQLGRVATPHSGFCRRKLSSNAALLGRCAAHRG